MQTKQNTHFIMSFIMVAFQETLSYKSYELILFRTSETFREVFGNF